MFKKLANTLLLISVSSISLAAEQTTLTDEADRINYSIGHQIGADFKKQGVELDSTSVRQGMQDGYEAKQPQVDSKEMSAALADLKRNITSDMRKKALAQMKERQAKTENIRSEGEAFLQANQEKEGVNVLPSGLQYKVITPGSGPKPGPKDQVTLHFRSRTIAGKEYNSSYKRGGPHTTKVNTMLPGLSEALQLMSPGAKWEIYMPPELAYGRRGPLAHHTIIFEAELLSIGELAKSEASDTTQGAQ